MITPCTRVPAAAILAALACSAHAATQCEDLATLKLPDTTVTLAETIAAGTFAPPDTGGKAKSAPGAYKDLPEFCRVTAAIHPTSDSDIKIELWMPVSTWNSKFEANGNAGWSGSITPNTLAPGLRLGYATAMTDTGHTGGSASFALGHPEKVIDFGYRAVHELTLKSKALIRAYYGQDPKFSYWNGCSAGGRQGMMEAQRYPEDFDGIVAGSPGLNWSGRAAQAVWVAQSARKTGAHAIPQAKFEAIHGAAIAACDATDGVKDGIIGDPRKCTFDPQSIACKAADDNSCLTEAQVETARAIYSDVVNPRTKQVIFERHEPGSELGWNTMAGANPFGLALDHFRYVVYGNANWDYKSFNFDSHAEEMRKASVTIDALDPDLRKFFARGGKLVQYHGWADPQISPGSSVSYYESVAKVLGGISTIQGNYRLFMVPGMAHCGGGEGTSTFDMLSALEQWVEQKKAPDEIAAARVVNGKTDRTRPLCPYPQVAVYKGSGSIDDAANFSCRVR